MRVLISFFFLIFSISVRADCGLERENGVVIDNINMLQWQACPYGMKWIDGQGCQGNSEPLTLIEAMDIAKKMGKGWRVPDIEELALLANTNCRGDSINKELLPLPSDSGDDTALFWSATKIQSMPYLYFTFDLLNKRIDGHTEKMAYSVRFVRYFNSTEILF